MDLSSDNLRNEFIREDRTRHGEQTWILILCASRVNLDPCQATDQFPNARRQTEGLFHAVLIKQP
jgi:hypothetical protein